MRRLWILRRNEREKKTQTRNKVNRIGILMTRNLVITWTVVFCCCCCAYFFGKKNENTCIFWESHAYFSFSFRLDFVPVFLLKQFFSFFLSSILYYDCDCDTVKCPFMWLPDCVWFMRHFFFHLFQLLVCDERVCVLFFLICQW